MRRVILIVLDSFGIGGAPDAAVFADQGANTLGTITRFCADRQTPLNIPNMLQLGLGQAAQCATGVYPAGLDAQLPVNGLWGAAQEVSKGKFCRIRVWVYRPKISVAIYKPWKRLAL